MLTKKEVRNYAYDLVCEGKNCITKLTDSDKENLSALLIESCDKFRASEFITESDSHLDLPFMLSKYMKTRSKELGQEILDFMVNNAVNYSSNNIVDVLIEQEQEHKFNEKYDGDEEE